jgi:hypothetical protein
MAVQVDGDDDGGGDDANATEALVSSHYSEPKGHHCSQQLKLL